MLSLGEDEGIGLVADGGLRELLLEDAGATLILRQVTGNGPYGGSTDDARFHAAVCAPGPIAHVDTFLADA